MQNNAVPKAERLNAEIQQVQVAASKLIARLADRAAYASPDEYQEIRGVMAAFACAWESAGVTPAGNPRLTRTVRDTRLQTG